MSNKTHVPTIAPITMNVILKASGIISLSKYISYRDEKKKQTLYEENTKIDNNIDI